MEEEYLVQLSLKDVAENGRNRLGKILDDEFNRIVREATLAERNGSNRGNKDLLGIRAQGGGDDGRREELRGWITVIKERLHHNDQDRTIKTSTKKSRVSAVRCR
jgi:hypothetical protein